MSGASLYEAFQPKAKVYLDKDVFRDVEEQLEAVKEAVTVYVGNLSFYTTDTMIHQHFSACGPVKRVIMGLNRNTREPCGFAFVEYFTAAAAKACIHMISGTKLDEREIRTELDSGFREGRQYGRGKSGDQVRDSMRTKRDEGRPTNFQGGDGDRRQSWSGGGGNQRKWMLSTGHGSGEGEREGAREGGANDGNDGCMHSTHVEGVGSWCVCVEGAGARGENYSLSESSSFLPIGM